jgi:hypothetical protein
MGPRKGAIQICSVCRTIFNGKDESAKNYIIRAADAGILYKFLYFLRGYDSIKIARIRDWLLATDFPAGILLLKRSGSERRVFLRQMGLLENV